MFKIVDKVEFAPEENKMQSIANTKEAIKRFLTQNKSKILDLKFLFQSKDLIG